MACVFDEHTPPFTVSATFAWALQVAVNGLMRRQSRYYATCYWSPWAGQRSGRRPGNKTLMWVVCGSLAAMSKWAMWIPRIVTVWAVSIMAGGGDIVI